MDVLNQFNHTCRIQRGSLHPAGTATVSSNVMPHVGAAQSGDTSSAYMADDELPDELGDEMQLTALHKAEQRTDQEGQRVYALLKSVADRLGDS